MDFLGWSGDLLRVLLVGFALFAVKRIYKEETVLKLSAAFDDLHFKRGVGVNEGQREKRADPETLDS